LTYLLDTHLLIWWLEDHPRLSGDVRKIIQEGAHVIFVSIASVWEISIKKSIGKLRSPENLEEEMKNGNFQFLPITMQHALVVGKLTRYHEDPFDCLLIAQAQHEGLILLTHDRRLKIYGPSVHFV
jgi:PIN domain nuclease of toxin-antitoxin system